MIKIDMISTNGSISKLSLSLVWSALWLVLGLGILFGGCSSRQTTRTTTERYDLYQNSKANAAAFGVIDSFTFGSPQEIRPPNDFEFYFKECELTSPDSTKAFFSKTAYSCSEAPID